MGRLRGDGDARDAAHDVDAELEAERVDIVAEGLEAGGVVFRARRDGRRKARGDWDVAAVGVDLVLQLVGVRAVLRVLEEPALIDDGVVPTGGLEVFVEDLDVGAELVFGDGEAVGVPAVPAHGRGRSWFGCCGLRHGALLKHREEEEARPTDFNIHLPGHLP